jgi:hypothetical protein
MTMNKVLNAYLIAAYNILYILLTTIDADNLKPGGRGNGQRPG